MRVSLTTKYRRHEHWWISSYLVPSVTAVSVARLQVEALASPPTWEGREHCRGVIAHSKACAAATAAGFVVDAAGDVCGFPYEFKPTTCKFWVDLMTDGVSDAPVSGMYPHEWDRIKRESPVTLNTMLEATLLKTLKIGNIEVPLFWYPPSCTSGGITLREYMRQHKLPRGV